MFSRETAVIPVECDPSWLVRSGYSLYNRTPNRACYERVRGMRVEHRAAGVIVFNQNIDKVLLVCNPGGYIWGFPKGHAEDSELLVDAAVREVREETGLDVPRSAILCTITFKKVIEMSEGRRRRMERIWRERRGDTPYRYAERGAHLVSCTLYVAIHVDDTLPTRLQPGETSAVEWVDFEEAFARLSGGDQAEAFLDALDQMWLPYPENVC